MKLLILLPLLGLAATGLCNPSDWQQQHDSLVARLRALAGTESAFGPAYQPLYHAALPWYERWGGRVQHGVDDWMVSPEVYAAELADALEHGQNYFAVNPGALLPLVFDAKLPGGRTASTSSWQHSRSIGTGYTLKATVWGRWRLGNGLWTIQSVSPPFRHGLDGASLFAP
jgi:hypothetical protein